MSTKQGDGNMSDRWSKWLDLGFAFSAEICYNKIYRFQALACMKNEFENLRKYWKTAVNAEVQGRC